MDDQVSEWPPMRMDPERARIWPGNARRYSGLTERTCRDLIDSIVAEHGQKIAAIVRPVTGDPDHDVEVIAGSRRHWAVSWLREHGHPDLMLLVQVEDLDDEAAFRIADIENRARRDVSDLERARNYANALALHYEGHAGRMADRLGVSKGWLSKMLKVATIPDTVLAAFAVPEELTLHMTYPLVRLMDDPDASAAIEAEAKAIAIEQEKRREACDRPIAVQATLRRLLDAPGDEGRQDAPLIIYKGPAPALTAQSSRRSGVTIRVHHGSGFEIEDAILAIRSLFRQLEKEGRGWVR